MEIVHRIFMCGFLHWHRESQLNNSRKIATFIWYNIVIWYIYMHYYENMYESLCLCFYMCMVCVVCWRDLQGTCGFFCVLAVPAFRPRLTLTTPPTFHFRETSRKLLTSRTTCLCLCGHDMLFVHRCRSRHLLHGSWFQITGQHLEVGPSLRPPRFVPSLSGSD